MSSADSRRNQVKIHPGFDQKLGVDPHRVELQAEELESTDSRALATGTIIIVVDTPLVDDGTDSRITR